MKKLLRNALAALFAVSLLGTFVACSSDDDDDPYVEKKEGTENNSGPKSDPGSNSSAENGNGNKNEDLYKPIVGSSEENDVPSQTTEDDTKYVKVISLTKNEYAASAQSQAKVALDFDTVSVGDKVVVKMKGKATRAFKAEMFIVDTTAEANYWLQLAEKHPSDEEGEYTLPAEFVYEHIFEITTAQIGTGSQSLMFALNSLDGDDTIKLQCTEYSITKEKGASSDKPETPSEKGEESKSNTELWSGNAQLDWSKGDNNGDVINADKFAGKTFSGLKFTISDSVKDATTIKIMQQGAWSDIPFAGVEGDGMIANSGDDSGKALWIWGNSVTVKFSEETIALIKENGIKFYGTGVTITKVELAE